MDAKLSGAERVARYGEALEKMSQNPKLPELFIHIFSRAYLPFRNPQTLNLFLQKIDDFKYEHSEDLGNAFEYLLSVMGSQGDAGQFRTPRHIIDFIVKAVDPTKEMRVLDPACGTGGFLISAYKHILDQYKDEKGRPGAKLTSSDKKKLAKNFSGYDISHDMVRLSLVNMYLHGIPEPSIHEYDTLTSEDRWGEKAECILANPPFMSPSGGIRPHSRFTIKATRSEVLFVDYIAEHLTTDGRAGIIVPEGIIFQSGTAYKKLREMLINDYGLFAIVSLPAGVFQPYSGVKTSVLLIDKNFAKTNNDILFVKINNDGFEIGAQRRPSSDKDDLPKAIELIKSYKDTKKLDKKNALAALSALLIPKEKIAASGDYNLSMDRYRDAVVNGKQKWPMVKLSDVIELKGGERITQKNDTGDKYPVYGGGGESFRTDNYNRENELLIARFAMSQHCVRFVEGKFWLLDSGFSYVIKKDYSKDISKTFVDFIFENIQDKIYLCARGHAQKNLDVKQFYQIQIPLPPLSVQEELVAELERYRKMTEGARAIIANYKPEIEINPEWEMRELGEVSENITDGKHGDCQPQVGSGYFFISAKDLHDNSIDYSKAREITKEDFLETHRRTRFEIGDVLLSNSGTIGKMAISRDKDLAARTTFQKSVAIIKPRTTKLTPTYLLYCLDTFRDQLNRLSDGSTQKNLLLRDIRSLKIPLPPLPIQQEIVTRLESERAEMEMLKGLVLRMEGQIREKVGAMWGSDKTETESESLPIPLETKSKTSIKPTDVHAGILAKIIKAHQITPEAMSTLGHVKAEKICHIIESHLGVDLGRAPRRLAAGPADFNHLKKVEHRAKMVDWFIVSKNGNKYDFTLKKNADQIINRIDAIFPDRREAINTIIAKFIKFDTTTAEIAATVYAAWNDLLSQGKSPNDSAIVIEARHNWTPEKENIPEIRFFECIKWLREESLIPNGKGKITKH